MKTMEKSKLTKTEEAILALARLMENPRHDELQIEEGILKILGYKKQKDHLTPLPD